jgi:predicted Zn-dependent protease
MVRRKVQMAILKAKTVVARRSIRMFTTKAKTVVARKRIRMFTMKAKAVMARQKVRMATMMAKIALLSICTRIEPSGWWPGTIKYLIYIIYISNIYKLLTDVGILVILFVITQT